MSKYKFNLDCPFWEQMDDKKKVININGISTPVAYYNLIVAIRDVKLYAVGIKPYRLWKVTNVKNYFGITGNATILKEKLEFIRDYLTHENQTI